MNAITRFNAQLDDMRSGSLGPIAKSLRLPRTNGQPGFALAQPLNSDIETIKKIVESYDPNKKYLFIYDMDGTLRPEDQMPLSCSRAVDPQVATKLDNLNQRDNFKNVILTARSAFDLLNANFPPSIIQYAGSGLEKLKRGKSGENAEISISSFCKYVKSESEKFVARLMRNHKLRDLINEGYIQGLYPGVADFCMRLDLASLNGQANKLREEIITEVEKCLGENWQIYEGDYGDSIVCIFKDFTFTKLHGLDEILYDCVQEGYSPDHVFMVGDGKPDEEVMQYLKLISGVGVNTFGFDATSIAVGEKISGDYQLSGPSAVSRLIDQLNHKVMNSL